MVYLHTDQYSMSHILLFSLLDHLGEETRLFAINLLISVYLRLFIAFNMISLLILLPHKEVVVRHPMELSQEPLYAHATTGTV
jgi:hypothetical protein